ncbi:MAG: hypothetical protein ACO3JL_11650, partial [Myxococcota bacterium]
HVERIATSTNGGDGTAFLSRNRAPMTLPAAGVVYALDTADLFDERKSMQMRRYVHHQGARNPWRTRFTTGTTHHAWRRAFSL